MTSTVLPHQHRPVLHLAPLEEVAAVGRRVQGPNPPVEANPPVSLGHLARREFVMISSREHASAATQQLPVSSPEEVSVSQRRQAPEEDQQNL